MSTRGMRYAYCMSMSVCAVRAAAVRVTAVAAAMRPAVRAAMTSAACAACMCMVESEERAERDCKSCNA